MSLKSKEVDSLLAFIGNKGLRVVSPHSAIAGLWNQIIQLSCSWHCKSLFARNKWGRWSELENLIYRIFEKKWVKVVIRYKLLVISTGNVMHRMESTVNIRYLKAAQRVDLNNFHHKKENCNYAWWWMLPDLLWPFHYIYIYIKWIIMLYTLN